MHFFLSTNSPLWRLFAVSKYQIRRMLKGGISNLILFHFQLFLNDLKKKRRRKFWRWKKVKAFNRQKGWLSYWFRAQSELLISNRSRRKFKVAIKPPEGGSIQTEPQDLDQRIHWILALYVLSINFTKGSYIIKL